MHLNSLTPMRISGTPLSFLNLGSRRPTPIEAVVIGGDLDSPLPILRVGLVSMNMLSSLSVVARTPQRGIQLGSVLGVSCSIHVAAHSDVICAIRTMGTEQAGSRIP